MIDLKKHFNLITAMKLEEVIHHLEDNRLNEAHVILSEMRNDFMLRHRNEQRLVTESLK